MSYIEEVTADICILGGGPAGYVAAIRGAQLGAKVILVEKREIGGTCLNRGCIPTKALLKTSETLDAINKAKAFGVDLSVASVNPDGCTSRKNRVVKSLRLGIEQLLAQNAVTVLKGRGWIEDTKRVAVKTIDGDVVVKYDKLIITTGSEPSMPDIPGIEYEGVMTSDEALEMKNIPKSLTIIGAGVIGLEFATLYNSLGTKVTMVEFMDSILPKEDREITAELLKIMKGHGIKFKLGSRVKEIRKVPSGLEILLDGEQTAILSEKILAATGRKLNSISPDIAALGVKVSKGAIVVNEAMKTSVDRVYAAGDVVGGSLLAHLAFAEGRVAAENAMGMQSRINYNTVPSCVYTNPEVAAVGYNEEQAQAKGITVKVGRFDFRNNGRALCHGEREGFVKVMMDKATGIILGARILGPNASELISELTLAVSLGIKADILANVIHPHPALAEAIMEACADAAGRAIHKKIT